MRRVHAWWTAAAVLVVANASFATPMYYTFEGLATGSVGDRNFTDAPFRIVVSADTSNFGEFEGSPVTGHSPATITIAGIGAGNFTRPLDVFANQSVSTVGLSDFDQGGDLIDLAAPAFAGYDLHDAIAPTPATAPPGGDAFGGQNLDIGALRFLSSKNYTFSASPVPEPAALGRALVACCLLVRRRGPAAGS